MISFLQNILNRTQRRKQRPPSVESVPSFVLFQNGLDAAHSFPRRRYKILRIDISAMCNLHCIYCEVGRGTKLMDLDRLKLFLRDKVDLVENLWCGCAMEPAINPRLGEFLLAFRDLAPPRHDFAIQTNGTLLDRHDPIIMRDAGLNKIGLSLDSTNPETIRYLRSGTDVAQVISNVDRVRAAIPKLTILLSVTVTSRNIDEIPDLVSFARKWGVGEMWFREVFWEQPVNHPEREALRLPPGRFDQLSQSIPCDDPKMQIHFLTNETQVHENRVHRQRAQGES